MPSRVRARTHRRCEQLLERHVIPPIGPMRLAEYAPCTCRPSSTECCPLASRLAPQRARIETCTVPSRKAFAGSSFRSTSSPPSGPTRLSPAITVPGNETVGRILHAAEGSRLYVPLVLAATTRMRRGRGPEHAVGVGRPRGRPGAGRDVPSARPRRASIRRSQDRPCEANGGATGGRRGRAPAAAQGPKPKVASEALGHSSVAFTLDVYSNVLALDAGAGGDGDPGRDSARRSQTSSDGRLRTRAVA
jgi:hypothetical protein